VSDERKYLKEISEVADQATNLILLIKALAEVGAEEAEGGDEDDV
jgi:hypothetical protein